VQGFFTDKTADAKARGVKLPTAADKESEFRQLMNSLDDELKEQVCARMLTGCLCAA
jgi:hypothetical protein